jgi:hypothetical protein
MPQPVTLIRQGAGELLKTVELVLQRFDLVVRGLPPIPHRVSDRSIPQLPARRPELEHSVSSGGLSISNMKEDASVRVPTKRLAQELT